VISDQCRDFNILIEIVQCPLNVPHDSLLLSFQCPLYATYHPSKVALQLPSVVEGHDPVRALSMIIRFHHHPVEILDVRACSQA
jgi:hypothetical protein